MDVDENFSLSKPKAPAKPGQEPEEVSLTHKTPADIKPTVRTTYIIIIQNIAYNRDFVAKIPNNTHLNGFII